MNFSGAVVHSDMEMHLNFNSVSMQPIVNGCAWGREGEREKIYVFG